MSATAWHLGGESASWLSFLWDRSCPVLAADMPLSGQRVGQVLELLRQEGRLPRSLRIDNGPGFTRRALNQWAEVHGVGLECSQPGKQTDNGLVESFNGKLRDECLEQNIVGSLGEARQPVEEWRRDYDCNRRTALSGGKARRLAGSPSALNPAGNH